MMSLPAGQRRALNQIEKALADDHPGLGPLFSIFTRLAGHEAMPATEQVRAQRWRWRRRMWPTAAIFAGLAAVTAALFTLSLTLPSRQVCPGAVTSASYMQPVRTRSVPAEHRNACATRQDKPGKTLQSGTRAH